MEWIKREAKKEKVTKKAKHPDKFKSHTKPTSTLTQTCESYSAAKYALWMRKHAGALNCLRKQAERKAGTKRKRKQTTKTKTETKIKIKICKTLPFITIFHDA